MALPRIPLLLHSRPERRDAGRCCQLRLGDEEACMLPRLQRSRCWHRGEHKALKVGFKRAALYTLGTRKNVVGKKIREPRAGQLYCSVEG